MKKPAEDDYEAAYLFDAAMKRYTEYLAAKKLRNQAYRTRRTQREVQAVREANTLKANRDIDPTREEWLMRAAKAILAHVDALGYVPTGPVKVSIGIPIAGKKRFLGSCYHATNSEGGYREIFIAPELTDTRFILGTLTHEIGHAVLKDGVGHRAPFKKFCVAVGFDFAETGKPEHAGDGPDWWLWASRIADDLGPIPHKKLNTTKPAGEKKKQKSRLIACECNGCKKKLWTTATALRAILETGYSYTNCIDPNCGGGTGIESLLSDLDEGEEGDEEE